MNHINIEIKAKSSNNDKIRAYLQRQNADFKGVDHQIDTYFNTLVGRLKLREGNIENTLIHYERSDQEGPKKSDVLLHFPEANSGLKEILKKSVGVKVVVDKHREIYFLDNVKFHLDKVKGLGTFVEIEAIEDKTQPTEEDLLKQCEYYIREFEILEEDLIAVSYSDLLTK